MKREKGGEREKERVREREGTVGERGRARREIEREVREVRERGRHNLGL